MGTPTNCTCEVVIATLASSLHVSCTNVETFGPVYTARIVSKSEPSVSIVTVPVDEGVKLYQTVLLMAANGGPVQSGGSPVSVVATIVLLVSVYGSGEADIALAKLSFAGVVPQTILRVRFPGTESTLPICMRYVVPEVAENWTAEVSPIPVSSLHATWVSRFRPVPV